MTTCSTLVFFGSSYLIGSMTEVGGFGFNLVMGTLGVVVGALCRLDEAGKAGLREATGCGMNIVSETFEVRCCFEANVVD